MIAFNIFLQKVHSIISWPSFKPWGHLWLLIFLPYTPIFAKQDNQTVDSTEKPVDKTVTQVQNAPYPNHQLIQQTIAKNIKDQDVIWITQGAKKYLSLYHQDEIGQRKGLLLIIPDNRQRITESESLNRLALDAAKSGWSTVMLSLQLGSGLSKEDAQKKQNALFSATINQYSKDNSGDWYLLLQGNNTNLIKHPQLNKFKGVILVNLLPIKKSPLSQKIISNHLKVFELLSQNIEDTEPFLFKQRKNRLKSSDISYRQIIINGADLNFSHLGSSLTRMITAWLNHQSKENKSQ